MKYEDKKTLWIIGGSLAAVAVIGYYFYQQGKKQTTIATLPPNDNVDEQGKPTSGATQQQLISIAAALYNDMKGINLTGHDVLPYQDAVNLSDVDFVRLYNIFNVKYQPESGETLTQWFNNEQYIFFGSTEGSIYYAFMNKLNKLNLK